MARENTRYEPLEFEEGGDSGHVRQPLPQRSVFLAPRTSADWIFVGVNVGLFLVTLYFWFSASKGLPSELECANVVSPYCELDGTACSADREHTPVFLVGILKFRPFPLCFFVLIILLLSTGPPCGGIVGREF